MARIFLNFLNLYKKQHKLRGFRGYKNINYYLYTDHRYFYNNKKVRKRCNYIAFLKNQITLPRGFIRFFKLGLRKFLKKKKYLKLFFFIQPNYLISTKNKNSRMGKGVGSYNRFVVIKRQYDPLFVILNGDGKRLHSLNFFIRYKLKINLFVYQASTFNYFNKYVYHTYTKTKKIN